MSKRKHSNVQKHIRNVKNNAIHGLIQAGVYVASIISPDFSESFQSDGDDWHAIGFSEMDERLTALKNKDKTEH